MENNRFRQMAAFAQRVDQRVDARDLSDIVVDLDQYSLAQAQTLSAICIDLGALSVILPESTMR